VLAGDKIGAAGLLPAFAVSIGGSALVAGIEPKPPLWGLFTLPAAPLALWVCAAGPLARLRGAWSAVAAVLVVLVPIAIAAAWLAVTKLLPAP